MLDLNTICPSPWIYSAPGDKGQIVYFPKMHCFLGPQNFRGPKIFHPHGRSTKWNSPIKTMFVTQTRVLSW